MSEEVRLMQLKELMLADDTDVGTLAVLLNLSVSDLIDAFPEQALELEERLNGRDPADEAVESWTADETGFTRHTGEIPWSDDQ